MGECYIPSIRSINFIIREDIFIWDTQKNIEDEEKWVQKKEELVKKTKENNNISGRDYTYQKSQYLDLCLARSGN